MRSAHVPVLLERVLDLLSPLQGGVYVDATVGLGGHAEGILAMIGPGGRLVGIDRDDAALLRAGERLRDDRVILRKGRFSDVASLVRAEDIEKVDGVLFDLGVSMMQLKDEERGFSFLSKARLDMRMDRSQSLSAFEVVNGYSRRDLERIIRDYAEEYRAARIAAAIVEERMKRPIETCAELAALVTRSIGRRGRIHPATKTFQALRIEVNREVQELSDGLAASVSILRRGGRLCVISYHSLEDRVVKNFIREGARLGTLRATAKKPIAPSREEVLVNPSARSAKLRGAERV